MCAMKTPPAQHQAKQPGRQKEMRPRPQGEAKAYKGSDKLRGKVALITGGDSGIGRAVAVAFAKEGADVAIAYRDEHEDANETRGIIDRVGRRCVTIDGDIGDESFCQQVVRETLDEFGRLDILVNNAGEQHPQASLEDITADQLLRTFKTNVFGMFYLTKAVLPHLREGSAIVNTASVTAYRGSPELLDYAATKGAIVAFTRSLSSSLLDKGIRVNAVAPGPIWTPLIPASYSAEETSHHGEDVPMERAGQPDEVAPSYVFLVSDDSSYISGQVLHPNGGEIVNG
jgi:NAD(P)-dependent dehydrogenase (short-subunit alcohol dehydrogenase family)